MKGIGPLLVVALILWLLSKRAKAEPVLPEPPVEPILSITHIAWTDLPPDEVAIGSYGRFVVTITNIEDYYKKYTLDVGCYRPDGVYESKVRGFNKGLAPGATWVQSSVKRFIYAGEYILVAVSNGVEIRHIVRVV